MVLNFKIKRLRANYVVDLALGAIERLIHHVINLDAITRIQLNELQGKMLRVVIASPQLSVDVFLDQANVRLEPTVTGHSETASIFEQRPFDQAQSHTAATATFNGGQCS